MTASATQRHRNIISIRKKQTDVIFSADGNNKNKQEFSLSGWTANKKNAP
mgnify:FL=1